jgi:hypothetical protein
MRERYSSKPDPNARCTCDTKADVLLALHGHEVAPCALHRPAPPEAGPDIALNSPLLTALIGMPVAPSEHDQ